jgi:predicted MFS family arabinose efflux permease
MQPSNALPALTVQQAFWLALALSVGAAISLGVTRFSYGLLLPPMRNDLHWSYTLAGAMNTANAMGYLIGALLTPRLMHRWGPFFLLWTSAVLAAALMASTGFFTAATALLVQRLLAGIVSAFMFIAGGLLAARLATQHPERGGLLLGLYYGGTGFGIVISALLVPAVLSLTDRLEHNWAYAWWALALACLLGCGLLVIPARRLRLLSTLTPASTVQNNRTAAFHWRDFSFSLAGYTLFGIGYIGYMTFVIALLKERGESASAVTVFYALLGCAVVLSSRIWSRLLDRFKGGQSLSVLNGLLGCATVLPVVAPAWPTVIVSGLMFGGVFLSVVASTTALVRHNLAPAAWAAGISAFTVVFAAGQIIGPTVVGLIADGSGGLARGLVFSACALWLGALLAAFQRPLVHPSN